MSRIASCLCGDFQVECEGEPLLHAQCSCRACQKTTGAPSAFWLYFTEEQLSDNGAGVRFKRGATLADGPTIQHCSRCGSTLLVSVGWTSDVLGMSIQAVPYGCFDEPDFPAPKMGVWSKYLPQWIEPSSPAECTMSEQPASLEQFRQTLIDFGIL